MSIKTLGTAFDRDFRNNANDNFTEHENEINSLDSRVSNIVANAGNSNTEIVDARQGDGVTYTSLRDHTDAIHGKIGNMNKIVISAEKYGVSTTKTRTENDTAIQSAISALLTTGGTIEFPAGTFNFTSLDLTQNPLKTITLKGRGIGSTIINTSSDGILIKSYLMRVQDLELRGNGVGSGIKVLQMAASGDSVVGRFWTSYVQASGYVNGFESENFDQMWIEKCNFGGNSNNGIFINLTRGAALLHISDTITNNNTQHGIHIYTTSIIGHATITNPECVANGKKGIHIEGSTTNSILSLILDNVDIEAVPAADGNNSALYLKNVWKFNIRVGQYSAKPSETIFASIRLDACKSGLIMNPWFRSPSDGVGTATNYIYVENGADQIYLIGSQYFGTYVDFTCDATTDKSKLINLDTIGRNSMKRFVPASDLVKAQGNPTLEVVGHSQVWSFDQAGVDASTQAVLYTSRMNARAIRKVTVYWANNGVGSGSVAWQIGFKGFSSGEVINASRSYSEQSQAAGSQYILNKNTITLSSALSKEFVNLWIIRNTGNVTGDTLPNKAVLLGIELEFE